MATKPKKLKNEPLGTKDLVINSLKAGLATAPFTGGLASLISDYIPNARQVRLEKFVEELAKDLCMVEDQVNQELIKTDEFAFLFEKAFKGAVENYQIEKIQAFKNIIVNSLTENFLDQEEKEYFLRMVDNLSVLHIRILHFMSEPRSYIEVNNIPPSSIQGRNFKSMLMVAIPNVDFSLIKLTFQDLYTSGLITTDQGIFDINTMSQGFALLGNGNRVSELGNKFIQFITIIHPDHR